MDPRQDQSRGLESWLQALVDMSLGGTESASIEILPFTPHFMKFSKTFFEVKLVSQCSHLEVLLLSKFGSERGDFN